MDTSEPLPLGAPLSPRALGALTRQHARRLPGLTAARAELEALLRLRGVPPFPAVCALEEAFGGLLGSFVALGAAAMHREPGNERWWHRSAADGSPLVVVGRDADGPCFVDEAGVVYGLAHGEPYPSRRAASAATWIETIALLDEAEASGRGAIRVALVHPREGHAPAAMRALADALAVPLDADASDAVRPIWQSALLTILPGELHRHALVPTPGHGTLLARTAEVAAQALRAAARLAPALRVRVAAACTDEAVAHPAKAPEPGPRELLDYAPVADGEGGSVWLPGAGADACIEQQVTFRGQVLCSERFAGAACQRLHFTGASDALAAVLSPRALRLITTGQGRRDPRARCDRATLTRLLASRGAPVSPAILAFEAQFGGLELTVGTPSSFGVYAGLRFPTARAVIVHDGRRLVPIGTREDTTYLMDEDGAVFTQPVEGDVEAVADSAAELFDELASTLGLDAPDAE